MARFCSAAILAAVGGKRKRSSQGGAPGQDSARPVARALGPWNQGAQDLIHSLRVLTGRTPGAARYSVAASPLFCSSDFGQCVSGPVFQVEFSKMSTGRTFLRALSIVARSHWWEIIHP